nr:MAG TPA: hypothetical protein [Caudoviricetes sp.]
MFLSNLRYTHEPYCYPINNVLFNRVRVATLFNGFIS